MYDVLIVGAGPVGLFLAGELGLAGCSVLVLERDADPRSPWRSAPLGLRGLNVASVEAFHRRGMLDELLAASGAPEGVGADPDAVVAPAPRVAGHFSGMMLDPDRIDLDALPDRLPGPAMEGLMTTLEAVESVLAARSSALGVTIRRGVEVHEIVETEDSVLVRGDGEEHEARWLAGGDGGRSTVRGLAGFELVGTAPQLTGYLLLATVTGLDELAPGFTLTPRGMYLRMPVDGHLGLMDVDGGAFDRSRPPTREHLQDVLRRISGADVTLDEVHHASTFTDRALQATTYRRGRVLLAGDAAHIHSPLGGQGLNLGLGDAMNLGWKLAATVHGSAPAGLLDTYTSERLPVGAQVLDWSRAQVAVMRPGAHATALRGVVRDLLETRDGTTYLHRRVSGAAVRLDLGDAGAGSALVGRSTPEFRLADGPFVGELLRDGRGVLLDLTADHRLRGPAGRWAGRVRYAPGPARDDLGYGAVLVRPDGVVAWTGDDGPGSEGAAGFEAAAERWFGVP